MAFTEKPLRYYDGSQWVEVFTEGAGDAEAPFSGHDTLADGIVAYWKLDSNALDSTGNGNDGTVYGATATSSGKINSCYSFDGNDDYIELPNGVLPQGDTSLTINVWVNYSDKTNNRNPTIWLKDNVYAFITSYDSNANGARGGIRDGSDSFISAESGIDVQGSYHMLTLVVDGADVSFYVNGSLEGSATGDGGISTPNEGNWVGFNNSGDYEVGEVDEVGIWGRALTSSEVADLYNNGNGLTY